MSSDARLVEYYEQLYAEAERLGRREGQLELARTQELLGRFLPPAPAKIIDIGAAQASMRRGWPRLAMMCSL